MHACKKKRKRKRILKYAKYANTLDTFVQCGKCAGKLIFSELEGVIQDWVCNSKICEK